MSEIIKFEKKNSLKIILPLLVAVGIILMLVGGALGKKEDEELSAAYAALPTEMDADAFAESVRRRVIDICSSISGAGKVDAVVTLGGGYRAIYASNVQGSGATYKSETVLTGSGNSERALIVGYETPKIVGIGIVCEGGDDPALRQSVISLVSAAFDVPTNRIYVASN